jgi:hypothetical protein
MFSVIEFPVHSNQFIRVLRLNSTICSLKDAHPGNRLLPRDFPAQYFTDGMLKGK